MWWEIIAVAAWMTIVLLGLYGLHVSVQADRDTADVRAIMRKEEAAADLRYRIRHPAEGTRTTVAVVRYEGRLHSHRLIYRPDQALDAIAVLLRQADDPDYPIDRAIAWRITSAIAADTANAEIRKSPAVTA